MRGGREPEITMRALFLQLSSCGFCKDPLFLLWCCCLNEKWLAATHCFNSNGDITAVLFSIIYPPIPPPFPSSTHLRLTPRLLRCDSLQLPAVLNQSLTAAAKYGPSCPPSPCQTSRGLPSTNHSKTEACLINTSGYRDDGCREHRLSVIWWGCQGADCQRPEKSGTIRKRVIYCGLLPCLWVLVCLCWALLFFMCACS